MAIRHLIFLKDIDDMLRFPIKSLLGIDYTIQGFWKISHILYLGIDAKP